MPPSPRSPLAKKPGAPKAKGAVRAKSGCYTCRIRRKKCDEQRDAEGRCQTCMRLRLECLGFGQKRPDWLRESRKVGEIRDKVKNFLAAQGMIKGHSGSGPRSTDHEPTFLRLREDPYNSSSSETASTPPLSPSEEERYSYRHISDIRHEVDPPPFRHSSGLHPSSPYFRSTSPEGSTTGHVSSDPFISAPNNTSLVPLPSPSQWSSFGRSYYLSPELIPDGETYVSEYDDGYTPWIQATPFVPPEMVDFYIQHYMENVLSIQYLLEDRKTFPMVVLQTITSHQATREAVIMLANVHFQRFCRPEERFVPAIDSRIQKIQATLGKEPMTSDGAMAALHLVSLFLFDGGRGSWDVFINMAARFVDGLLYNPNFNGPAAVLAQCGQKEAFVIKTAIWFDVLAAVTTQKAPHYLKPIRAMFNPSNVVLHSPYGDPPPNSMMSPMGCENKVVWALAETLELSVWKKNQASKGKLSNNILVSKAANIELALTPSMHMPPPTDDVIAYSRHLTSEIFRCATRLFLQSVVSGDFPNVPEIRDCVDETMRAIEAVWVEQNQDVSRSVIRSTVFGIYICGCLTNDRNHRNKLLSTLEKGACNDGVGNCDSIRKLLTDIWAPPNPIADPVDWRGRLTDSTTNSRILLV